VIRICGYQGAEKKGGKRAFLSLYIRTTRKIKKVREKFLILAKYFFGLLEWWFFCYMVFQKNTLNMDGSYNYDSFMRILPEL